MSHYLVTGGAGYIGSHVAQHILAQGHSVCIIDNLVSGVRSRITDDMEFVEGDIRDADVLKKAMKGAAGVFHLAALPRVPYSVEHPFEVHEVNTMGTLNVLVTAAECGVKRVVFSSSSAVYGNAKKLPTDEKQEIGPLNPYALSKYFGEQLMMQHAELYGIETVSLRYFNAYGPRMREDGAYATVVSAFIGRRHRNQPLVIHGTGEQSRDFVHVTDIARANWLAMNAQKIGKGEVINIGSGSANTVLAIAERMKGKEGIEYQAPRAGDAMHTLASVKKAKKLLGWEPTISFEKGIEDVLRAEEIQ